MKLVLDTNVLVSGIFWNGQPARILELWTEGVFDLIVSYEILDEYKRILRKIGIKYASNDLAESWIEFISQNAILVDSPEIFKGCRDPHDNKFIDCAIASRAKIIISGDEDLLSIKKVGNIIVVDCRKALDYLKHRSS